MVRDREDIIERKQQLMNCFLSEDIHKRALERGQTDADGLQLKTRI